MTATELSNDDQELAALGYKQELVRTLGSFSTFATGFAFISILTGMFLLFGFNYTSGGPGSIWAWCAAVVGQLLFALAFAELAARYPLAGSVYNWSKQLASKTTSWLAGVSMALAFVVSMAAVALAMQAILPSISSVFVLYGSASSSSDSEINAVILGSIMIVLTTIVSLMGTRIKAMVNNFGVSVELIGCSVLVLLLLVHAKRGPQVVFKTNGTGFGHTGGYFGALMLCLLLGLTIQWGFDTAGAVSEETINPRKTNPRAIIRALLASGVFGALLLLTAFMSLKHLNDPNIASGGLAYVLKSAVGSAIGNVLLACSAIAVFVCGLANQTGAVNMMYAMARDNALPGSERIAKVSPRSRTPIFPTVLVAVLAIAFLLALMKQPGILLVATSVTVTFALFAYACVVGPFALNRLRGRWVGPGEGYFSLGRAGLAISSIAFIWAVVMIVNIAWPRKILYNPGAPFHWYLQWGGILFPAIALGVLYLVYRFTQRKKIGVLASHAIHQPTPTYTEQAPTATY